MSKVLYLKDAKASGSNHGSLQDGGTAPASTMIASGWIVGTVAATKYARLAYTAERASSAHLTTVEPSGSPNNAVQTGAGDCFRSEDPISGRFQAGDWTFDLEVIGETQATSTHDGKIRVRVWRSTSATGANATELTGATQVTGAYANLTNTVLQALQVVWAAPLFELNGEYLFVQLAHQLDGAGDNAASDVHLRVGSGNVVTTASFSFVGVVTATVAVRGPDVVEEGTVVVRAFPGGSRLRELAEARRLSRIVGASRHQLARLVAAALAEGNTLLQVARSGSFLTDSARVVVSGSVVVQRVWWEEMGEIVAVVRTTGGEALGDGGTVVAATALSGSEALGDEGSNVAVVVLAGDYALDPP